MTRVFLQADTPDECGGIEVFTVAPHWAAAAALGGSVVGTWPLLSLAPTGVAAAAYGDSAHVGQFTVSADGRLTAAANVAIVGLLSATGVTPASYGDATHVAQITVDANGVITAAANVAISGGGSTAWASLTGIPDLVVALGAQTHPGTEGRFLYWIESTLSFAWGSVGAGLDFTAGNLSATGSAPAWASITGVPARVTELAALGAPGTDQLVIWSVGGAALNYAGVGSGLQMIANILSTTDAYAAGNPGDWAGPAPTTIAAALDRIARVVSLSGAVPIP